MLLADVLVFQRDRLRNPWVWMPTLGLGLFLVLSLLPLLSSVPRRMHLVEWASLILGTFSTSALIVWLSPVPWLYTGNRASHAPFLRGVVQSAAFGTFCVLAVALLQVGLQALGGVSMRKTLAAQLTLSGVLQIVPIAMLAGYFITLWERTRFVKEETERKLREAHWVLLRGQLSPHALFNALNGLAELVRSDPAAAEQGILDLSSLYRALLDHGSKPSSSLDEERALVERYLAVERLRLGNRLETHWEWPEALGRVETPPFLVQPLVENAIKHGIAPSPSGGRLEIALREEGQDFVLRVTNTGKALPLLLGNGVGVGNLEARLYLAYGDKARFRLTGEGETTIAEIRIALDALRRLP